VHGSNQGLGEGPERGRPARIGRKERARSEHSDDAPRGWHARGYLPHFDGGEIWQTVTFRLADSFPSERLQAWQWDLRLLPKEQADAELRRRIEEYLDRGHGDCHLRRPEVAAMVQEALLFFDAQRYRLDAWVVMPNHVHVLFLPFAPWGMSSILHSWKSYSAKQANRLLGRSGDFWHEDYRDRFIRDEEHFQAERWYIENNPVKAGLCARSEDWPYGSARQRSSAG
jgi:REP element-mobilizing transposase RayT